MLNNTIIFLLKNAVNNRDVVEQNIGKNVIKGLSNILHASANVPDNQVNLGFGRLKQMGARFGNPITKPSNNSTTRSTYHTQTRSFWIL